MRYFIADLHFFHKSLNEQMDKRGFATVEDMHDYIIKRWNNKVRPGDEVVILGDFSMGKGEETGEILDKLNGIKYLIEGNHDKFLEDRKFDKTKFRWIKDYYEFKDKKRKIVLSHYPIMCYNGQYRHDDKGMPRAYMLYGHVHNSHDELLVHKYQKMVRETLILKRDGSEYKNIPCHMINCFCMFSDYEPLTLDEWIENDRCRREKLEEIINEEKND